MVEQNVIELMKYGIINSFTLYHLLLTGLGVFAGIIVGVLPGLTSTMACALLIPLTFAMRPESGLVLLGAIWTGAIYGASNAAILVNIPGTPASIATALDGYALTKKGESEKALFTGLISSVLGGLIGVILLIIFFAPLAKLSVKFGQAEYFWLCIFGLSSISSVASTNIVKGLLGGTIGLLVGTIGLDPIIGIPRFTFGFRALIEGVELVPALIGVFAIPQVLSLIEQNLEVISKYKSTPNLIRRILREMSHSHKSLLMRSSLIGSFIGMLPGAGAPVASLISYSEAMRWDKNPEEYGKGSIKGVMASESANNATIGSSLIPMMGLGIPGCPTAAVIMGALLMHGILPGSKLLVQSGDIAYTFIFSLVMANFLMIFIGYFMLKGTANIIRIPVNWITPMVLVLSVIGSYAMRNSMMDVYSMLTLGIIAFLLTKGGVEGGPIALGLVLGPICERALGISLTIAEAKETILGVLVFRPLCILFIFLSIITLIAPKLKKKKINISTNTSSTKKTVTLPSETKIIDIFLGSGCLIIASIFIYQSYGLTYPSITFPLFTAYAMGILSLVILFKGLTLTIKSKQYFDITVTNIKNVLIICFTSVAYVISINKLGFYVSSFTFIMAISILLSRKRITTSKILLGLATSSIFLLIIHTIFGYFLRTIIPSGVAF